MTSHVEASLAPLEIRSGVAWLTLNRPAKANAVDRGLSVAAAAAARAAAADRDVQVLVVTGAGRHFCAGMDLAAAEERSPVRPNPVAELCAALAAVPVPVIAAINGAATGGGCELALCADLRIASAGATIALPEIRFGALPAAGGTQRLPRLVGAAVAKRLIWTGETLTADAAREIGLVDEVVAADRLVETVEELATVLSARPRYALIAAKRLVGHAADGGALAAGLELEAAVVRDMATGQERAAERQRAARASDTYNRLFGAPSSGEVAPWA